MLSNHRQQQQQQHRPRFVMVLVCFLFVVLTTPITVTGSAAAAFVVNPKLSTMASSKQQQQQQQLHVRHPTFTTTSTPTFIPMKAAATNDKNDCDNTIPNTFPASTRQALIQKAKELNQFPSTTTSTSKNSNAAYSTVGWSNRLGTVLVPAAIPGVYTADRPFFWNRIDVGCRMTVIELPTTTTTKNNTTTNTDSSTSTTSSKPDLWIHSPVGLDGPLQQVLDQLGTVRHVVSPNYEHVKFAKAWALAYPDATVWGCPGMKDKEPHAAPWNTEIPNGYTPSDPELWSGIQTLHMNLEINPFTGTPFFNECIFFHTPSSTLLTTDLYWNYPQRDGIPNSNLISEIEKKDYYNNDDDTDDDDDDNNNNINGPWELAPPVDTIPFGSQLWKFGMDRIYLPFYTNIMIQNKKAFRESILHVLLSSSSNDNNNNNNNDDEGAWSHVKTLIPAHGDIIRGTKTIQKVLKQHFGVN